jgi:hypothetical protein
MVSGLPAERDKAESGGKAASKSDTPVKQSSYPRGQVGPHREAGVLADFVSPRT